MTGAEVDIAVKSDSFNKLGRPATTSDNYAIISVLFNPAVNRDDVTVSYNSKSIKLTYIRTLDSAYVDVVKRRLL